MNTDRPHIGLPLIYEHLQITAKNESKSKAIPVTGHGSP
jgi:hypothetical protein